jgi:4-hydroxymandelate oxidase
VHPLLAAQAASAVVPDEVRCYWDGGAGDEVALHEAAAAWARLRLRPRVLRDVSSVATSVDLLGSRLRTPVLVGPTALHGLAHPDARRRPPAEPPPPAA